MMHKIASMRKMMHKIASMRKMMRKITVMPKMMRKTMGKITFMHKWSLLEISLSDFRRLTTLNVNTYLPSTVSLRPDLQIFSDFSGFLRIPVISPSLKSYVYMAVYSYLIVSPCLSSYNIRNIFLICIVFHR